MNDHCSGKSSLHVGSVITGAGREIVAAATGDCELLTKGLLDRWTAVTLEAADWPEVIDCLLTFV